MCVVLFFGKWKHMILFIYLTKFAFILHLLNSFSPAILSYLNKSVSKPPFICLDPNGSIRSTLMSPA